MSNKTKKARWGMNKSSSPTTSKLFFRLPLEPNTVKLRLKTLNSYSEFKRPDRPYLRINIRKIYFRNEVLTIGVKLNDEIEERVFIRVKEKELLVSCTVDTDETYLSRYAYFTLIELMSLNDFHDFEEFYWPGFFNPTTGKSKYLNIINDRRGMDVFLKPNYLHFYKPGHKLVFPSSNSEIILRASLIHEEGDAEWENDYTIGYCLADTNLQSLHSNHFPFLVPYYGILTKGREAVKTFQAFIVRKEPELPVILTPIQVQLNKICFEMMEFAPIKSYRYRSSTEEIEEIKSENSATAVKLFKLWAQAISLLNNQIHTHYHFTYGMSNVSGKPRKKNIEVCRFSMEIPMICFFLIDKGQYYELHLRFKVKNKTLVPYGCNTEFFLRAQNDAMTFYLLNNIADYKIASFFAKHGFKLAVLKSHYKNEFKDFINRLAEFYEVK